MQSDFYLNKLYPLQDEVLARISAIPNTFYLTGGTALGRHYLKHRYSDDIDLFLNQSSDFSIQTQNIYKNLLEEKSFTLREDMISDGFVRFFVVKNDCELKVEFVNDVSYRFGEPKQTSLFLRTDNWENILSNKISALTRFAPKDVADILFLSRKFSFNWRAVVEQAKEKDMWVNPLSASDVLNTFRTDFFEQVNWIHEIDYLQAAKDVHQISKDILSGSDNTIFQK